MMVMAPLMDVCFLALVLSGFGGRSSFGNKLITEDDYYQSKLLRGCFPFLCLQSRVFAFGLSARSIIAFIIDINHNLQKHGIVGK